MQRVISCVRSTLSDLQLAIEGTIIMNEALRNALNSIFDAKVPQSWAKVRCTPYPVTISLELQCEYSCFTYYFFHRYLGSRQVLGFGSADCWIEMHSFGHGYSTENRISFG